MNLELLRVAIALAGTALAAKQDHDTSYIDDKLTIGMAAIGGVLTLLSEDWAFIGSTFLIAILVFAIGYAMYRTGQIGGGDVLLFTAIALLVPHYPSFALAQTSFLSLPPVALAVISSSFFAIIGTAVSNARMLNWRRLRPEFKAETGLMIVFSLTIILSAVFAQNNVVFAAVIALILASAVFLYAFRKQIMQDIIIKKVPIEELEDEDLLAIEEFPPLLVKKYALGKIYSVHAKSKDVVESKVVPLSISEKFADGVRAVFHAASDVNFTHKETLEEIQRKYKMKRFPVYKNLPRLGPYILLALLAIVFIGDLMAFFF